MCAAHLQRHANDARGLIAQNHDRVLLGALLKEGSGVAVKEVKVLTSSEFCDFLPASNACTHKM